LLCRAANEYGVGGASSASIFGFFICGSNHDPNKPDHAPHLLVMWLDLRANRYAFGREGKPVPTFSGSSFVFVLSMIFAENRFPLFRIMLCYASLSLNVRKRQERLSGCG